MTNPASPLLSLCVPTFNRGRYLASLLESLVVQMAEFPHPYEVVISDNACTDDTPEVVKRFLDTLPIRYIRHPEGIGCYPNVIFAMTQARGRYMMYLADDDCVLGESLAEAVAGMQADPGIVITYAPWMLFDLVAQQPQGQFYEVPRDLRIERGQHAELLGHILRHHIFPEIYIARTEVMKRLMPRVNDIAFYAFSQAADYLAQGAVLIRQKPFYVAITRYFADETRSQVGNGEVEVAWDRYRGGLEYMMARAGAAIGAEERAGLHLRIQHLIAQRMSVAIRLRHAQGKDPLDVHTLAMRLKGMGYEHLLPVPMQVLASQATLHFLLQDTALNRGMERLVCVGPMDAGAKDYLKRHAPRPVDFLGAAPKASLKDALLFVSDRVEDFEPSVEEQQARNWHIVRERDLCDRFGLVPALIEIHPTARVSPLADVEDSVRGTRIVVGARSVIDSFVKVKPVGGSGDLVIGEHSVVNSGCVLYTGNGIRIGDHVAIAANTTFAPVNHAFEDRSRLIAEQGFLPSKGGIVVEDDVWIGANCVLLDGAVLRRGCVIGAGSLVRGEVAAGTVNAGNPLVRLGERQ